jgi:hypothetical protein
MRSVRRTAVVAACCGVLVFTGGASGLATSGGRAPADDEEPPITWDAWTRATAAATAATGGDRVAGTEVGDEESYYEVEIILDDGTEVDVHLDQFFTVVGASTDVATPSHISPGQ